MYQLTSECVLKPAISPSSSSAFPGAATWQPADDGIVSAALVRRPLPLLDRDLLVELRLQLAQLAEDGVELMVLRVLDVDEAAAVLLLPRLLRTASQHSAVTIPTVNVEALDGNRGWV